MAMNQPVKYEEATKHVECQHTDVPIPLGLALAAIGRIQDGTRLGDPVQELVEDALWLQDNGFASVVCEEDAEGTVAGGDTFIWNCAYCHTEHQTPTQGDDE